MNLFKIIWLVLLLVVISFFHCSKKPYEIKAVDGIRYIKNNYVSSPRAIDISLKFPLGADEKTWLYIPVSVSCDSDTNIYILETGSLRIKKFSKSGELICDFGRKGDGPGELRSSQSIKIDKNGNIYVFDNVKQSFEIYDSSGKWLSTKRTYKNISDFYITKNNTLIMKSGVKDTLMCEYELNGDMINKFCIPSFIAKAFSASVKSILFTGDNNNNVYVCYRYFNRIEKYSSARNLEWVSETILGFKQNTEPGMKEVAIQGAKISKPRINQVFKSISVDVKSRVWLLAFRREEKAEEMAFTIMPISDPGSIEHPTAVGNKNTEKPNPPLYELQVFNDSGILISIIPITDYYLDNIYIFGNLLFTIDSNKTMMVYVYKIIETGNQ